MVAVEGSKIDTPKKVKLGQKMPIALRVLNGVKLPAGDAQNAYCVPLVPCSVWANENKRGFGFPHVFPQDCGKVLKP